MQMMMMIINGERERGGEGREGASEGGQMDDEK